MALPNLSKTGLNLFTMAGDKGLDNMVNGEDKSLTSGLNMDKISAFKSLLSAKYVDSDGKEIEIFDDDKVEDTWKIMHGFVKQSIMYIHNNRSMVDGEYTKEYFSNVNIKENAEKWKVKTIA